MTPCTGNDPMNEGVDGPEKQPGKQDAGPSSKSLVWATERCRGFARWKEFGETRNPIRHEVEPAKLWPQGTPPIDPLVEAEMDAAAKLSRNLAGEDYAFVTEQLRLFCAGRPFLAMLGELVYHVHREGQTERPELLVKTFRVWVPFESVKAQLGEIGADIHAMHWLRKFERHLAAAIEALPAQEAKEA